MSKHPLKLLLQDLVRLFLMISCVADANPAGENSYPIVSLTWILAYPEYSKNDNVKDMLRYMLTPTQQQKADSLGYVPLPEELRQKTLTASCRNSTLTSSLHYYIL